MMLQQTQVSRVIPKFEVFIKRFPNFQSLSKASLGEVQKAWSGLGYNRRAKFLWQAARIITQQYSGKLPSDSAELVRLPGIGQNTAGAILAYAFDKPTVFVETNIRTVFIHHFFKDRTAIDDKELLPLIEQTLNEVAPRLWYWALMDYGVFLKTTEGNLAAKSRHYTKQSKFQGSRRQLRGQIQRLLIIKPHTSGQFRRTIADERLPGILEDLASEGLIVLIAQHYQLPWSYKLMVKYLVGGTSPRWKDI